MVLTLYFINLRFNMTSFSFYSHINIRFTFVSFSDTIFCTICFHKSISDHLSWTQGSDNDSALYKVDKDNRLGLRTKISEASVRVGFSDTEKYWCRCRTFATPGTGVSVMAKSSR